MVRRGESMSGSRVQRTEARGGSKQRVVGAILFGLGLLLLAATGAYYVYGVVAKSKLHELVYSEERPTLVGADAGPSAGSMRIGEGKAARGAAAAVAGPESTEHSTGNEAIPEVGATASESATSPSAASSDGSAVILSERGSTREAPPDERGTSGAPQAMEVASHVDGQDSGATVIEQTESIRIQAPDVEFRRVADGPKVAVSETPTEAVAQESAAPYVGAAHDEGVVRVPYGVLTTENATLPGPGSATQDQEPEVAAAAPPAEGASFRRENLEKSEASEKEPSGVEVEPALEKSPSPIELSKAEAASYVVPSPIDDSGDTSPAVRLRIPAIGVSSTVKDLHVVFLSDSLAWETPNRVVGHIPTTPRPGAAGQGWYFGHLESPVRGEGNVFKRLPEVARLAETGPVYLFVDTDNGSYLYRVYKTEVVHQDELRIKDSGERDITLVACVPRFHYDHRLLVTAALVGTRESLSRPPDDLKQLRSLTP